LVLTLVAGPVRAGERPPHGLALGAGWFDFNRRLDQAAELRLEYRSSLRLPRPLAGVFVTTDRSVYLYGAFGFDIPLGRLVLTPSFGPGGYFRGEGKELGHVLEFRSQVELAWRFGGGSRLGVSVCHISNAGLGERNPGTESLTLTYELPLARSGRSRQPSQ
jgi:hypothetical protein